MTVYFFYEAGTVVCPRASNGGVSVFLRSRNRGMATGIFPLCNSRGKIPVAISRFLLREKKKSHPIRRGLVFLVVILLLLIPHW